MTPYGDNSLTVILLILYFLLEIRFCAILPDVISRLIFSILVDLLFAFFFTFLFLYIYCFSASVVSG